jgi:hypothetical protein
MPGLRAPADDDSTECHAGHAHQLLRFCGDSVIPATVRLGISWLARDPQPAHLLTRIGDDGGSPWATGNPIRATRPPGMPRRRPLHARRWWLFNDLVPGTRQPATVRQQRCPSRRRVSPARAPPGSPAFARWRPAALPSPHAARQQHGGLVNLAASWRVIGRGYLAGALPWPRAIAPASLRLVTWSFSRMCVTWTLTVFSVMNRLLAIRRLVRPSARSSST